jgi:hypothetical protein
MMAKGKAIAPQAGQALRIPGDEAPRLQDIRHIKVVRMSALRSDRLCPAVNNPGTHFC